MSSFYIKMWRKDEKGRYISWCKMNGKNGSEWFVLGIWTLGLCGEEQEHADTL